MSIPSMTAQLQSAASLQQTVGVLPEIRALNSSFMTLALDGQGRILRANNRFLDFYGWELQDIKGQMDPALAAEHTGDEEQQKIWHELRRGEIQSLTYRCTGKDGLEKWFAATYSPIRNSDGQLIEIIKIAYDDTSNQLRSASERGQIASINASLAVVHLSLDGIILDANQKFLDLMGYAYDEMVGLHHHVFVAVTDRESDAEAAMWLALFEGRQQAAEIKRIGKGGREIWLHSTYNPICDLNGKPFKIIKYATDITQQKLQQAEHEWQIAAIHKSHAVITFDMYGTIIDANQNFLAAVGYRLNDIVGRHHRMFVDPAYAHSVEYAAFWHGLTRGDYQCGQYRRIGNGGREVWLQASYNPVFDMNGRPIKVMKYATVVTETKLQQAEHQGQIAAIHHSQCVISFALDGTILDANDNFLDATGYRYAEVRDQHHRMFVPADHAASEDYSAFWANLVAGRHHAGEYKRICKDGREIWLQATYNPIFDMNGRPFKVVKYATDITNEKLRHADFEGQIEAINKSQGVLTLSMDGKIQDVNAKYLKALGYTLEELKGKNYEMIIDPGYAKSPEYDEFWNTLRSGGFHSGMFKRIGKDGREVWIQASCNPIFDLNGVPSKIINIVTDVTSNVAMAAAYENASRQAQHDAATALPNRLRLASFMAGELANAGARLVVLYLDLDKFKPINDSLGHHAGDAVLGEIANRLRRCLRHDQIVARVGGDEFVIAAPDLAEADIEPLCRLLIDTICAPIRFESHDLKVGASIGIAVSPADGVGPDELLRCADAALYKSKQNGRGTYTFFSEDMNDRIQDQRRLIEDMRRAIPAGEFFLEYQPRFDTRGLVIRGVEALVRWSHPERGRISPADFIALAERSGLIVPLGDWIMRTACEAATRWPDIGISINVSPLQFRDGDVLALVKDVLAKTGLCAERLEIEITEGVLMENEARSREALFALKALGVRIAIDDFGTGYSSLSYLQSFPFDVIKIDRRFIADVENQEGGGAIVQAVIGLGQSLGASVTAEGVETNSQLAILTNGHCPEVQGFLLARPMTEDRLSVLLLKKMLNDADMQALRYDERDVA